ncbi:MAG: hypothetical protein AAF840_03625, partial [Bacteroidota bacterium]
PGIIFRPPPGLEILSVEGEYAGNSGNREAMTLFARPDGSLFVDITDHSQVTGDSLPGLITTVATDPRLFQFYLRYVTDCDFQPGSRIGFQAVGNSPCGDPAIGTSTQTLSNALNIAGAETYQTSISVTDEPLIGCTSAANVNVRYTIIGDETTDGDTTLLTLPPGVVFNSFTNVSAAPNTVELVANETQADGSTEVRFKIPPGLPNFSELEFDFSVTASPSAACSDSLAYSLIHTVTLPPIMCGMDSTCVNATVVISGQNNQGFVVEKTFVTLDLIEACTFENEYGVDGRIIVDSLALTNNDPLEVRVFCASDLTTPIDSFTLVAEINPGDTLSFYQTINRGCAVTDSLVFQIDNTENCICNPVEESILPFPPILVEAGANTTLCSARTLDLRTIGASISGGTTDGVWMTSGDGTFNDGAGIFSVATTYSPGLQDLANGEFTLTLRPDLVGTCADNIFDEVTLTILKVDCGQFNWDGSDN